MDQTHETTVGPGQSATVRVGVQFHARGLPVVLSFVSLAFVFLYWGTVRLTETHGELSYGLEAAAWFFDLNGENNAPTWFSSSLWLFAAFLALGACSQSSRKYDQRRWRSLSMLFALLSVDEAAGLHEKIGHGLDQYVSLTGAFHYAWVLYGIAFLSLVVAFYFRFIISLPRKVVILIACAAAIFLSGALGLEMLGAAVESGVAKFPPGLSWHRAIALEELLEMLGVILLIHALLIFLRDNHPLSVFTFGVRSAQSNRTTDTKRHKS